MKLSKSWLVPGLVGVGLGYLLSNHLSGLLPIHPLAYQGRMARPHPAVHPIAHPAVHHPAVPHLTYVPVRRSFDRSYDSWLHTTVNALPPIG